MSYMGVSQGSGISDVKLHACMEHVCIQHAIACQQGHFVTANE